jgi:hypothetical protein
VIVKSRNKFDSDEEDGVLLGILKDNNESLVNELDFAN